MGKEIKTHNIKVLGRRITIKTEAHPDLIPPQTTFSINGTLRGIPVKEVNMSGYFIGTKNGVFLQNTHKELEDRIQNPQYWKAKFTTS